MFEKPYRWRPTRSNPACSRPCRRSREAANRRFRRGPPVMGMFERVRNWFGPGAPPDRAPVRPASPHLGQAGGARNPRVGGHQSRLRPHREPGCRRLLPSLRSPRLATHGVIALVADGMGGCNGGEVASALACDKIPKVYFASNGPAPAALRASLEAVNGEIYQTAQAQPELRGMGTTAVAFAITSSHGWLAYVGDSRLYLIRRGQIYRMSEDHSMVFEMVHKGLLTRRRSAQPCRSQRALARPRQPSASRGVLLGRAVSHSGRRPLPALLRRSARSGDRSRKCWPWPAPASLTSPPSVWCAPPMKMAATITSR
jgi:hypothetical protein